MIKKTFAIALILMLVVVPIVFADAAYDPSKPDEDFIEFEISVLTPEIKLDEDVVFEITITNLTNDKIMLESFVTGGLSRYYRVFGIYDEMNEYVGSLTLKAHETVVVEMKVKADEETEWEREDGIYYSYILPAIEYTVNDDYENQHFIQEYNEEIKLEIVNLHDDPGYFESIWFDNGDTFYYQDTSDETHTNYWGICYGMAAFRNASQEMIDGQVKPGTVQVFDSMCNSHVDSIKKIKETIDYTYHYQFKHNDEYYVSSISRTYKTDIIYPPEINLQLIPVKNDTDMSGDKYKIVVTNPNDYNIEDFALITDYSWERYGDDNYVKRADIPANSKVEFTTILNGDYNSGNVLVGYIINGQSYMWRTNGRYSEEKTMAYEPIGYRSYCFFDKYDYLLNYTSYLTDLGRPTYTPMPKDYYLSLTPTYESTVTPNPDMSIISTADMTDEEIEKLLAKMRVVDRRSNMITAFVIIFALIAIAAVIIIYVIKRKINKQKE